MGMTSCKEDIKMLTDCGIGKVYLNHKEYEPQIEGNRILDCETGNFHLFPKLQEDDCETWLEFFKQEETIRNEVIKELKEKLQSELDEDYIIEERTGSRGNLVGIPEFYTERGVNHFFRCIQVTRGDRNYVLLFKRFYIDDQQCVNCVFGDVQFFSSNSGQMNEKVDESVNDIITFTYGRNKKYNENKNKSLKKIKVHYPKGDTNNSDNLYDPEGIKNICDLTQKEDEKKVSTKIVEEFIKFIKLADHIGSIQITEEE